MVAHPMCFPRTHTHGHHGGSQPNRNHNRGSGRSLELGGSGLGPNAMCLCCVGGENLTSNYLLLFLFALLTMCRIYLYGVDNQAFRCQLIINYIFHYLGIFNRTLILIVCLLPFLNFKTPSSLGELNQHSRGPISCKGPPRIGCQASQGVTIHVFFTCSTGVGFCGS